MSANTTYTTCVECDGTGQRPPFEYQGEMLTKCPWCDGTGQVEVSYAVFGGGFNGDFNWRELYTICDTLEDAKRYAEREMRSKDRFENTLADGTPTLQYMEVQGQADEMMAVEEKDGQLFWSEA